MEVLFELTMEKKHYYKDFQMQLKKVLKHDTL